MNDSKNNMEKNVINFGAGPAKLPEEVMKEVQGELLEFENTKVSICELSHRSADFKRVVDDTVATLRDILHVPNNYKIIFLQGGGQGLFASIPMNLMNLKKSNTADYIVTGSWSAKAAKEAMKYGKVNMVLPKQTQYTGIPPSSSWQLDNEASYVYYCDNETVHGVEFHHIPETNGVPLVADMSSNFLSRPFDVSKFALVFAGAQKNFGPAGVAVVIVREDVLGHAMPICPSIFDFNLVAAENSLLNTPPAFQIWFVGKVFKWIKRNGGVEQMEKLAIVKSKKIYDVINESNGFYKCAINPDSQSRMNIPFRINNDEALEKKFVDIATSRGMLQLKGHRSVGGIRASLYNAITEKEAQILADYMKWFYEEHRK